VKRSSVGRRILDRILFARLVLRTKAVRFRAKRSRGPGFTGGHGEARAQRRTFRLSADGSPTFFGYYDKTPFDRADQRILAMSLVARRDDRVEATRLPARLGYFDWSDLVSGRPRFRQFGQTEAWSWQQGCMLQWVDFDGQPTAFYNSVGEGRYRSVIQNVETSKKVRELPFPLYAIDPTGQRGASLNFSRLERLRPGYGYSCIPDPTVGSPAPEEDGIWRHDLRTEESTLVASLNSIARFRSEPSMRDAVHYVNHLQFNPDGTKLVFLHLWMPKGPRRNRLMLLDFSSDSIDVLDAGATVSHFNWLSPSRLVIFRVPFQGRPGYYVADLEACTESRMTPLTGISLTVDGHPSLSPVGDLLLTDSYPDDLGEQGLYVHSLREEKTTHLASFYSPCRYRGQLRCDLHPRWSRSGDRICFDSTQDGRRAMYVMDGIRLE